MKKYLLYFSFLFATAGHAQTLQWNEVSLGDNNGASAVKVYETTSEYNGRLFAAKYVEVDLSNDEVKFQCIKSEGSLQTLADFEKEEEMHTYITINGGFFGGVDSYSHVAHNGVLLAPNFRSVNRKSYADYTTHSYPVTRGTLGVSSEGLLSAGWVYTPFVANDTYIYDEPLKQSQNVLPLDAPLGEDGELWNMSEAIGGGPLLVRHDFIVHSKTDNHELFGYDIITGNAPRTAIGYRDSVTLIMLVVDGRQTSYSMGCSIDELAQIMLDLGCTTALNLDGGGSSAININGVLANSPSDGSVRTVSTAVMVTSTTKKNITVATPELKKENELIENAYKTDYGVTVEFNQNDLSESVTVNLYDLTGRLLKTVTQNNESSLFLPVNTKSMIYILQARRENHVETMKL